MTKSWHYRLFYSCYYFNMDQNALPDILYFTFAIKLAKKDLFNGSNRFPSKHNPSYGFTEFYS